MGAEEFSNDESGETMQAAFKAAVEEAQYDHGHSGYTGTIAEKDEFIDLTDEWVEAWKENSISAKEFANQLLETGEGDERIRPKWGPCGGIEYEPGRYYFFGWASS